MNVLGVIPILQRLVNSNRLDLTTKRGAIYVLQFEVNLLAVKSLKKGHDVVLDNTYVCTYQSFQENCFRPVFRRTTPNRPHRYLQPAISVYKRYVSITVRDRIRYCDRFSESSYLEAKITPAFLMWRS